MSDRRIGRYILDVLVSQTGAVELWQGYDPTLERPVSVRLVPAGDPRAAAAEAAARGAATVDDRRIIAVLDILTGEQIVDDQSGAAPGSTSYLAIVSEWVDGRTLTDIDEEREGEPIEIDEVIPVMRQVAIALQHSHEFDVHHRRLRPGSLLISETADFDDPFTLLGDTNVVRIRGLAVDDSLWPEDGPGQDDIVGIGSLLYAMLTGRWPLGLVDGMSPAPRVGDRLLPPSQVVADVPPTIDDICMRAIGPEASGDPRVQPYPSVSAVVSALGAWEQRPGRRALTLAARESAGSRGSQRALRMAGRVLVAAAAVVAVTAVGFAGLRLAQSSASPWGVSATGAPTEVLTQVGEITAIGSVGGLPGEVVPVNAIDFDPQGDGEEMPDLVPNAIDERSDTAWTTDTYYSSDLGGKPGTGLVLDLGESTPVSAVRLELVGSGSSIEVLVASEPYRKTRKWTRLAGAEGIGTAIDLRAPRPVVGRYVLIWFTQLPLVDGVYSGGLRDVIVFR